MRKEFTAAKNTLVKEMQKTSRDIKKKVHDKDSTKTVLHKLGEQEARQLEKEGRASSSFEERLAKIEVKHSERSATLADKMSSRGMHKGCAAHLQFALKALEQNLILPIPVNRRGRFTGKLPVTLSEFRDENQELKCEERELIEQNTLLLAALEDARLVLDAMHTDDDEFSAQELELDCVSTALPSPAANTPREGSSPAAARRKMLTGSLASTDVPYRDGEDSPQSTLFEHTYSDRSAEVSPTNLFPSRSCPQSRARLGRDPQTASEGLGSATGSAALSSSNRELGSQLSTEPSQLGSGNGGVDASSLQKQKEMLLSGSLTVEGLGTSRRAVLESVIIDAVQQQSAPTARSPHSQRALVDSATTWGQVLLLLSRAVSVRDFSPSQLHVLLQSAYVNVDDPSESAIRDNVASLVQSGQISVDSLSAAEQLNCLLYGVIDVASLSASQRAHLLMSARVRPDEESETNGINIDLLGSSEQLQLLLAGAITERALSAARTIFGERSVTPQSVPWEGGNGERMTSSQLLDLLWQGRVSVFSLSASQREQLLNSVRLASGLQSGTSGVTSQQQYSQRMEPASVDLLTPLELMQALFSGAVSVNAVSSAQRQHLSLLCHQAGSNALPIEPTVQSAGPCLYSLPLGTPRAITQPFESATFAGRVAQRNSHILRTSSPQTHRVRSGSPQPLLTAASQGYSVDVGAPSRNMLPAGQEALTDRRQACIVTTQRQTPRLSAATVVPTRGRVPGPTLATDYSRGSGKAMFGSVSCSTPRVRTQEVRSRSMDNCWRLGSSAHSGMAARPPQSPQIEMRSHRSAVTPFSRGSEVPCSNHSALPVRQVSSPFHVTVGSAQRVHSGSRYPVIACSLPPGHLGSPQPRLSARPSLSPACRTLTPGAGYAFVAQKLPMEPTTSLASTRACTSFDSASGWSHGNTHPSFMPSTSSANSGPTKWCEHQAHETAIEGNVEESKKNRDASTGDGERLFHAVKKITANALREYRMMMDEDLL